jgi:hypothetical protein
MRLQKLGKINSLRSPEREKWRGSGQRIASQIAVAVTWQRVASMTWEIPLAFQGWAGQRLAFRLETNRQFLHVDIVPLAFDPLSLRMVTIGIATTTVMGESSRFMCAATTGVTAHTSEAIIAPARARVRRADDLQLMAEDWPQMLEDRERSPSPHASSAISLLNRSPDRLLAASNPPVA